MIKVGQCDSESIKVLLNNDNYIFTLGALECEFI